MKCILAVALCIFMQMGHALLAEPVSRDTGRTSSEKIVLNVRDFAARGDGFSDDTPSIQAAIDTAQARGGGSVYLPPTAHFYKTVSHLQLKAGVTLYGNGDSSRIFRTSPGGAVIDVNDQSDFTIHHLRISGSGMLERQSTFGINIHNGSHDGSVANCTIDDHYLGIAVQGVSEKDDFRIAISNNMIRNIGLNPVGINTRGHDITVSGNTFDSFGSVGTLGNIAAGVEMRGVIGGAISSNAIRNGSSHWGTPVVDGIRLEYLTEMPDQNPQLIECSGNVIDSIGGYGVRAIYARHCQITKNTLTALGVGGIYLVSSDGARKTCDSVTISANQIDRAHDGIVLESTHAGETNHRFQCTHTEISGNRITQSGQYGLHIWGGSYTSVTSNRVFRCGNISIYQHGGSNNTFTNNTVSDASLGSRTPLPACYAAGDTNNVFLNTTIFKSDSASTQINEIRIGEHAVGTVVTPAKPSSPPLNYHPALKTSVTVMRSLNLVGIKVTPVSGACE